MRQRISRKSAWSMLAVAPLLGASLFTAAPASASAAAVTAGVSGTVAIMGNDCGFPTSARPNSRFVSSHGNCNDCLRKKTALQYKYSWRYYYCTYNPSNNLNDLHYQGI
ncbi:hypothetical protein AB0G15_21175 [Streptosporangium sp. NPDC023825]|uniref:hypothetical protein n=1 Tax=Streptosporangium sp. NPDC023825 TaxID=3154909 RepID=UPI00343822BB